MIRIRLYKKIYGIKKMIHQCKKQIKKLSYFQETERHHILSKQKKKELLHHNRGKYQKFFDKVYEEENVTKDDFTNLKRIRITEEMQSFEDIKYAYEDLVEILRLRLPFNYTISEFEKQQRQLDKMMKIAAIMALIVMFLVILLLSIFIVINLNQLI